MGHWTHPPQQWDHEHIHVCNNGILNTSTVTWAFSWDVWCVCYVDQYHSRFRIQGETATSLKVLCYIALLYISIIWSHKTKIFSHVALVFSFLRESIAAVNDVKCTFGGELWMLFVQMERSLSSLCQVRPCHHSGQRSWDEDIFNPNIVNDLFCVYKTWV